MPNFTKDLSTWYPLLPKNTLPGVLGGIRGLHILCVIPIGDVGGLSMNVPYTSWIRCYLTSPSEAILDIGGIKLYSIPLAVIQGVDTPVTYSKLQSFIVIDKDTDIASLTSSIRAHAASSSKLYIHPDCLEIYTEAPTLQLIGNKFLDISDDYDPDTDAFKEPQYIDLIPQESVNLCDGYNCAIDTAYNLISFTGGENFGAGIMRVVDPALFTNGGATISVEDLSIDEETGYFMHPAGAGLRSINGLSDSVVIKGMGDAVVATTYEDLLPDGQQAQSQYPDNQAIHSHSITITVSERPNADDDDGTPEV